jgi:hypothetical protein
MSPNSVPVAPWPELPAESPDAELPAESLDAEPTAIDTAVAEAKESVPRARRRRQPRIDPSELKLKGRLAICQGIDIAPRLPKRVKQYVLGSILDSNWEMSGKEDEELAALILKESKKLTDQKRILAAAISNDRDPELGDLKAIIFEILLQEETYSIPEPRLYERVIDFEKDLLKRSRSFGLDELKKVDPERWHSLDTYRIVLNAAWGNDDSISADEAELLAVLREHLNITREEHWLIGATLRRFPKVKCVLHTGPEINETRKDLQKQALLWTYKDADDQTIDLIPAEIAEVLRTHSGQELQVVNYERLVSHDAILIGDLREVLASFGLDKTGNKPDLIERIVYSSIRPSALLDSLDKDRLSAMCASAELKTSGAKAELIARLITFYDDLTFKEIVTRDEREEWYASYELLSRRANAELRAKNLIKKDLEIEHKFEDATAFLFEKRLRVPCDMTRKDSRADGRLDLDDNQCILFDCKSVEQAVNLQDHLEGQFDGYLRRVREGGKLPLGFIVIGPAFTPQSIKLAHQYKARTNWDIALVTAEGLWHLAEKWFNNEPEKPFPIRLLNRTGNIIDKDGAEVLLGLV